MYFNIGDLAYKYVDMFELSNKCIFVIYNLQLADACENIAKMKDEIQYTDKKYIDFLQKKMDKLIEHLKKMYRKEEMINAIFNITKNGVKEEQLKIDDLKKLIEIKHKKISYIT